MQILVEIVVFECGVGHFECKFQGDWGSPTNDCRHQKTRVPVLSCGIVCMILRLAVLTQYRRVTDIQMDGQTKGQMDRHTMKASTVLA